MDLMPKIPFATLFHSKDYLSKDSIRLALLFMNYKRYFEAGEKKVSLASTNSMCPFPKH